MTTAEDLLARTRTLATEVVAPNAPRWDQARALGREGLDAAAQIGLTGLQVPVAQGGLGLPFSVKATAGAILAEADFGFAMSVLNTQNVTHRLTRDADPRLAAAYLPDLLAARRLGCTALTEPGAGSDFAAITTTATPDGDGWRLNGQKCWIINAVEADLVVVYAQTQPGGGARGIASFLVDGTRPGFTRGAPIAMSGQHSIGAGQFTLNDYPVAPHEVIKGPGDAFKSALTDINGARIYVAAMCCGMVRAALNIAADHGRARRTFGQRLADHQGWRWRLAEADTDLAAADALVAAGAQLVDAEADAIAAAARAKLFATRMAERHLGALAQAMGAEGLRETYPFTRHLIGARVASFTDGASEMLLERLARPYTKDEESPR